MMLGNKNKNSKEINNEAFSKEELAFGNKLSSLMAKDENKTLQKYINFIYGNDFSEFVKSTYRIRLFGIIAMFMGIGISLLSILIFPIMIVSGIFIGLIGFLFVFYPMILIRPLITNQMHGIEKNAYLSRYDTLRDFYYNIKIYDNPFYIANSKEMKKENSIKYMIFKFLGSDESPAFYEKFLSLAELFQDNFDLSKFYKEISDKIKGRGFEEYFNKEQNENKEGVKTTLVERATLKESLTTMLILGFGIVGIFAGLGGFMQQFFGLIYVHILSTVGASVAGSSLASSLFIFQMITTLPPLYLLYLAGYLIVFIIIIKMRNDNKSMFG